LNRKKLQVNKKSSSSFSILKKTGTLHNLHSVFSARPLLADICSNKYHIENLNNGINNYKMMNFGEPWKLKYKGGVSLNLS
jgi:hypothetical protein